MKITNIILALLFALFAYWQINDSDSWLWLAIYGLIAVMYVAAAMGKHNKYLVFLGIVGSVIGIGLLFPELLKWVEMGTPNIAESMKTDRPYIEFVREFFGLVLTSLALLFLFFQWRRSEV